MKGTALITGAAKRIGLSLALYLANVGYDIALHYNKSQKEAKLLAKDIRHIGRKCETFRCDLSKPNEYLKLISNVKKKMPNFFTLINSASIFEKNSFIKSKETQDTLFWEINYKAPYYLSRDFAKICKKGNIINILDSRVAINDTDFFTYSMTKKALLSFTKMAAKELSPNIRVNAIAPGNILSPNLYSQKIKKISKQSQQKEKIKLHYLCQSINSFLENRLITGECIYLDEGKKL